MEPNIVVTLQQANLLTMPTDRQERQAAEDQLNLLSQEEVDGLISAARKLGLQGEMVWDARSQTFAWSYR